MNCDKLVIKRLSCTIRPIFIRLITLENIWQNMRNSENVVSIVLGIVR